MLVWETASLDLLPQRPRQQQLVELGQWQVQGQGQGGHQAAGGRWPMASVSTTQPAVPYRGWGPMGPLGQLARSHWWLQRPG